MSYEVGTYVPLEKVNKPFTGTFQDEAKEKYDYTFKTIGNTLKAFRRIEVATV